MKKLKKLATWLVAVVMFFSIVPPITVEGVQNMPSRSYLGVDILAYQTGNGVRQYPNRFNTLTMAGIERGSGVSFAIGSGWGTNAFYYIGGQFTTFSGIYGPVDGMRGSNYSIRIADENDRELAVFTVSSGDLPTPFSINVVGVRQLRMSRVRPFATSTGTGRIALANAVLVQGEQQNRVTINATAQPTGGGTVTGGGTFNVRQWVNLEARPNSGWRFDGWYEGGIRISSNNWLDFEARTNRNLQARFTNGGGQRPVVQARTIYASTMGTSFAIDSNGTLWSWGRPVQYQLGDGSTSYRPTPAPILNNIVSVGENSALTVDGRLLIWGYAQYSHEGQYAATLRPLPTEIMRDVVSFSHAHVGTLAIDNSGRMWARGSGFSGRIGDGTFSARHSPVLVMENVVAVCTVGGSSFAIGTDGSLWSWGRNDFGQLGDGRNVNHSTTPSRIKDNVVAIASGSSHVLALTADGNLWAWGENRDGALGDGTTVSRNTPTLIMGNVISIEAGTRGRSAAITSDGVLWVWGLNDFGQVGDGTTVNRLSPVRILEGVASVSVGFHHTLAVRTDGSLWAWGNNLWNQLGDGTTTDRHTPVRIMDNIMIPTNRIINDDTQIDNGIVGDWYVTRVESHWRGELIQSAIFQEGEIVFVFSSNGTGEIVNEGERDIFTWEMDGTNRIQMRFGSYELVYTMNINSHNLTLTHRDGDDEVIMELRRVRR